ncbi:hypothetical protein E2562_038520 [Oryza meyeriana var. granulata]|uniref:Uncharacterized protein n=1 Tax=Oryza meyeriana var. granulata TaxID=110450 RepID=A0A6G1FGZ6_9ORYZ|nr:hypothetical protein E2562_038520 [Oryza meyeriana var. granulata]
MHCGSVLVGATRGGFGVVATHQRRRQRQATTPGGGRDGLKVARWIGDGAATRVTRQRTARRERATVGATTAGAETTV